MSVKKKNELRQFYFINLEIGLIVTLLVFLGIFRMELNPGNEKEYEQQKQETVEMEEVVQTEQEEKVAAPPKPQAPVEVPNDEIIDEELSGFDSELNLGSSLDLPDEPPSADDEGDDGSDEVFVVVERMPKLKGGLGQLQQKINYPEVARKAGIEGRVIVQFIVDENGNVVNPKVVRGIGGGCDKEALRVVRTAQFQPGMQRGKPVKVRYTLPIVFKLSNAN